MKEKESHSENSQLSSAISLAAEVLGRQDPSSDNARLAEPVNPHKKSLAENFALKTPHCGASSDIRARVVTSAVQVVRQIPMSSDTALPF